MNHPERMYEFTEEEFEEIMDKMISINIESETIIEKLRQKKIKKIKEEQKDRYNVPIDNLWK